MLERATAIQLNRGNKEWYTNNNWLNKEQNDEMCSLWTNHTIHTQFQFH